MLKAIRDSKVKNLLNRSHLLSVGLGVLLIANALLSVGIYSVLGSERVVLLWPTSGEEYWVKPNKASPAYLKEMSQYLLLSTLNVTPQTAASRREVILNYVHPSGYGEIKSQMIEEEEILKKKNITKMFTPIGFEVDEKNLKVKAIGELTTWVAKEVISQQKRNYILRYHMNAGKLQLIEFREDRDEKTT